MKRLQFQYHMKLSFSDKVCNHRFSLKCVPRNTDMQRIEECKLTVYPDHINSEDYDSHGNITLFGYTDECHKSFGFDMKGLAVTGLSKYERAKELHKVGMYRYQTKITKPGVEVKRFHDLLNISALGNADSVSFNIMEKVFERLTYKQGLTVMDTTAEEAITEGVGVCQDYAHVMLSLCRMEKIPCRYVTGMLMGEGSSHAWVEVWDDNKWIGFDPTNNKRVDDEYIKISNGRDYGDCLVNQGIFTGNVTQTQEISVLVNEELNG